MYVTIVNLFLYLSRADFLDKVCYHLRSMRIDPSLDAATLAQVDLALANVPECDYVRVCRYIGKFADVYDYDASYDGFELLQTGECQQVFESEFLPCYGCPPVAVFKCLSNSILLKKSQL